MSTAAIQTFESRLQGMVGKTYMFNTNCFKVQNYQFIEGKLLIGTDKKIFPIEIENVHRVLDMFLETDQEETPTGHQVKFEMKSLSGAAEIKDILMANIKSVQENKDYIPQAVAVNDTVKTLLDFAKTEIQMYDIMYKINSPKK